jgi:membrane-associated protease RseP (regulator of RpoE activity)
MRIRLWLPLFVLALGLAALGGFAVGAWALGDNGDGAKSASSAVEASAPQEQGEAGESVSKPTPTPSEGEEPGYLGVVLGESPDGQGVLVQRVASDSPAERAGIKADDVIVAVDGEKVNAPDKLAGIVQDAGAGAELTLTVMRDGDERDVDVTLDERPSPLAEPFPELPREMPGLPDGGAFPGLGPFLFPQLAPLLEQPERLLERFVRAELSFLNDEGDVETVRAVAGTVESVKTDELVLAPKDGKPNEHFQVSDDTRVWRFSGTDNQNHDMWMWRSFEALELSDLKKGDSAVVVARDDEAVAVVVLEDNSAEGTS